MKIIIFFRNLTGQRTLATLLALFMGVVSWTIAPNANASLIALLGESNPNDSDGLAYLENVLGITGLTLLAKEDIGGGFTGSIDKADWSLTDTGRSGNWIIDDDTVTPTYFFNKFDSLLAVYSVMDADGVSPWMDSYNLDTQVGTDPTVLVDIVDNNGNVLFAAGDYPNFPPPNPWADTSHVSVYAGGDGGDPPDIIPEPAIILLSALGLLGVGFSRRRKILK